VPPLDVPPLDVPPLDAPPLALPPPDPPSSLRVAVPSEQASPRAAKTISVKALVTGKRVARRGNTNTFADMG
jgi:hypothetical protein